MNGKGLQIIVPATSSKISHQIPRRFNEFPIMFSRAPQQFCQLFLKQQRKLKHLPFLTQNISVSNFTVTNAVHMAGVTISCCFKVMLVAKTDTDDPIRITSLSAALLPSGAGVTGGYMSA